MPQRPHPVELFEACCLFSWQSSLILNLCPLTPVGMQMPALFQHHAELPGKHCRRRKARTVFSDSQLSGLEKRFEIQRYLSTPERVELATALSLSETQVHTHAHARARAWKLSGDQNNIILFFF